MQTVKDLTIDEFKAMVGEVVEEKLRELLTNPDAGLTLRPEIEVRLRQQLENPKLDGECIPAAEVARRLGLDGMVNVGNRVPAACGRGFYQSR
jgi:hypothetical protein